MQVFIINGSGGAGKDTFVEMVKINDELPRIRYGRCVRQVYNYSSVTKIKQIAKVIGWNGDKTEKDRKFLSDLKLLISDYNDLPLTDMKKYIEYLNILTKETDNTILFLHIREISEISRAINEFKEYNTKTILVKRDSIKHITSNMADKNVYNYD